MNREKLALAKSEVSKNTVDDAALSLELLKLVYRHDKEPEYLVKRAMELKRLLLEPES